jgi:uncharacterized protein
VAFFRRVGLTYIFTQNQYISMAAYIQKTQAWLETFVIGLNLCPFARKPYTLGRIHFELCLEPELEPILEQAYASATKLVQGKAPDTDTTLFIVPNGLSDFSDYLDALEILDALIAEAGWEGILQVASFHPAYEFADSTADDPANHTNRSPYPMFHFLLEAQVSQAVNAYPDTLEIPDRNVAFMRKLGQVGIDQLWEKI